MCANTFCCCVLLMFVWLFKIFQYNFRGKHIIFTTVKLFYDLKIKTILHFEWKLFLQSLNNTLVNIKNEQSKNTFYLSLDHNFIHT